MPIPKLVATAVMMAAQVALTALSTTEGPRLTDTKATVADYGTACNNFIGDRLLSAHCVFAKDIEEKKKKRKGKAGKQVSYTGYGTWFVQIAEHPIDDVLQIFFDNHLVYDKTGSGEKVYPLADDYDFEANVRFMLGGEDQEPDPDMLAYIEARDGPGTCPAYRHMSGIYFERNPLEQLGNRRPDVKVLARNGGTSGDPDDWISEFNVDLPDPLPTIGDADVANVGNWNLMIDMELLTAGLAPGTNYGPAYLTLYYRTDTDELTAQHYIGGGDPAPGIVKVGDWHYVTWTDFLTTEPSDPLAVAFRYQDGIATVRTWWGLYTAGRFYTEIQGRADSVGGGDTLDLSVTETENGGAPYALEVDFDPDGRVDFESGGADYVKREINWLSTAIDDYAIEHLVASTTVPTLETLLTQVALRGGLDPDEFDFSQATQPIPGYNWSQGSGQQICEAPCDVFDVDLRPHDFVIEALPRGMASLGPIETGEFVFDDKAPFRLVPTADEDLPRRVFLTYADTTIGQDPNTAMPLGGPDIGHSNSTGEMSIDLQSLALDPDTAQALVERRQRRERFGRTTGEFALTRRRHTLEPGDVHTPSFDGNAMTMRATKLTIGADGVIATEWTRDEPRIAVLPGSVGAPSAGWHEPSLPTSVDSVGAVLDLPLLIDAHEQTAPLAYLSAGPSEPGVWMGADYAASDTGELDSYLEGWDGIAAGDGAVIGTTVDALPAALSTVPDMGSLLLVDVNSGELTGATLDELLADPALNLAAVQSGDAWELVQFMVPVLVAERRYAIAGLLRGVRGTEHAIAGHAPGDAFHLLDGTVKRRTMGASEIGDTDSYIVSTSGQEVDQDDAFALEYTGASHRPYAPVGGILTFDSGTGDILIDATRRTRIGGATLNGQDVPLGESAEAWEADVIDGTDVVRTLTGASLPLTYTAADQTADFGAPVTGGFTIRLHQMSPALSLRGYPLEIES